MASYADPAGNKEQFLYSQDGLKKRRVSGAATTLFTYDEAALLLETDTSNDIQARYTNAPETWGGLASQNRSGVSGFYGFDSQQCARILVSMAGIITDSYSYKVFGEALQSGSGTVNPYRYIANGLYYWELADLVNAWNRWLKSSVGRWDSSDMLGFDGGDWNLYPDVANNSAMLIDPSGNIPCSQPRDPDVIGITRPPGLWCDCRKPATAFQRCVCAFLNDDDSIFERCRIMKAKCDQLLFGSQAQIQCMQQVFACLKEVKERNSYIRGNCSGFKLTGSDQGFLKKCQGLNAPLWPSPPPPADLHQRKGDV